jgi:hypothetical protein
VKEEPGQKQVVIFVCFFLYIWMWVNIYLYISNTHIYDKRRLYTKGVGRLLFNQERKLGDQRLSDTVLFLYIKYTSQTLEDKIK